MSSKYKIGDERYSHFVTFTVVNWIDVFTRNEYRNIIIEILKYCIEHKSLYLHAFCIMTNHVHLILSSKEGARLSFIIQDMKKTHFQYIVKSN
jgi:putative transposase